MSSLADQFVSSRISRSNSAAKTKVAQCKRTEQPSSRSCPLDNWPIMFRAFLLADELILPQAS